MNREELQAMSGRSHRGGARPGAGRKPVPEAERLTPVAYKVKAETASAIAEIAESLGISKGKVLDEIVANYSDLGRKGR